MRHFKPICFQMIKSMALFVLLSLGCGPVKAATSCEQSLAPKLSSMFYVWVNNPGTSKLSPAYEKFVKKLQPGGVLLGDPLKKQSLDSFQKLVQNTRELYPQDQPPFVGADYLSIDPQNGNSKPDENVNLGFGTGVGAARSNLHPVDLVKNFSEICLAVMGQIRAIAHRVIGINHPLGPIVESPMNDANSKAESTRQFGEMMTSVIADEQLVPTLKHFPFTPKGVNLHKATISVPLSDEKLKTLQENFFLSNTTDDVVVMTTHVSSPDVDQDKMVTISKEWIDHLRSGIGNKSLIMTDGLFMLGNYPNKVKEISGISEKELKTYFSTDGLEPKAYNFTNDRCYSLVVPQIVKYRNQNITGEVVKAVGKSLDSKDPCYIHSMNYFMDLSRPGFDPDKAKEVGQKVIDSFAEKAILAGHDLIIMEGHPNTILASHRNLVASACSGKNGELKERIEESANRIQEFKVQNRRKLNDRSKEAWLSQHRYDLEKLFFEIYPRLNSPKTACENDDLRRAEAVFKTLCR